MRKLEHFALPVLLLFTALGADGMRAQNYPTKPIRVHTAGAGGGSDIAARLVAAELAAPLGQAVVIENRPAGVALPAGVAKAAPDGYTLLANGATVWIAPLLGEVPYDPTRDLAPVTMLTRAPNLLVITRSLPVKSVAELIKLARSRPGDLNVSTGADGSGTHTGAELFKSMAGVDIVRIWYKNQSSETGDLLSGEVQMTFGSAQSMAALIRSGRLRALASGGVQRSTLFPDLPTVGETLPGYVSEAVVGFFAPGKTPEVILRRLYQETARVLERPEVRERLTATWAEPAGGTPESLADYIRSDVARMSKILKTSGGRPAGS